MVVVKTLVVEMTKYYVEERLAQRLRESDHEILYDIGNEVLTDEGYPDWVKLKDVDYAIDLTTRYSFEDWAELAKAIFHIDNIKQFVKEEMYEMFVDFIDLFDVKIRILTDKEEIESEA